MTEEEAEAEGEEEEEEGGGGAERSDGRKSKRRQRKEIKVRWMTNSMRSKGLVQTDKKNRKTIPKTEIWHENK